MKVLISKEKLFEKLTTASRAISTRSAIQSLSGVLLRAESGYIELSATDMEIGVRLKVEAKVEEPGVVVIPGRLFLDVVRSLSDTEITIESANEELLVECGTAKFKLKLYPEDEFPQLPDAATEGVVNVSSSHFTETVQRVVGSASRDEARPVLTGVLVSAEGKNLVMVATDSYRLSVKETEVDNPVAGSLEVNVPARAMQELLRISAAVESDEIRIGMSGSQVVFEIGDVTLSSRLIDGQFPNYKQLIPEAFDHQVVLDGNEFLEVVRRIGLMAQKNTPLKIALEKGQITVSASTSDVGEAVEAMPVRYEGDGLEIGFNPEFLKDGLESAGAGAVELNLISALRPGLIKAVDGKGFKYLIMPVRLNV